MPETFLILLAGGALLAASISNPLDVTLQWLRLAGIIALTMLGLSIFFWMRRDLGSSGIEKAAYGVCALAVCGQLAFTQVARRQLQRAFATLGFAASFAVAMPLLSHPPGFSGWLLPAYAGVGATCGIALMEMLLGHAYLTASRMTMAPLRRLNNSLCVALVCRIVTAVAIVLWLNAQRPVEMLWRVYGLYIATRWLVGLLIPGIFVWMVHDCIKRRATQSATGILYVAGVLIFVGEITALYLIRQTGLPF